MILEGKQLELSILDQMQNGMLGNMDCTVYLKRSEFSLGQCWRNAVSILIPASRAFRRSVGSREEERSVL